MTNGERFKDLFGLYATEVWAMPEKDFLEWLNTPTTAAEPIKHGRWIKNEDRSGWHCSCCGKDDLYAYTYTENNERELQDFYCPNCGARMDLIGEDKSHPFAESVMMGE